ncbi:uncharacterized protein LOC135461907 [Liolophura sinensis]|uniref:uncharacterized protein LOC135461907 n=1 Tax=Liolophura sinensis TaxID=3198878 RepID=UPI003159307B
MMKIAVIYCLIVSLLRREAHAVITASESDFVVDCGTTMGGPIRVVYINKDPANNRVVKMSGLRNLPTCVAQSCSNGVLTISDLRTNCNIAQPDLTQSIYEIKIILQEFDLIYMATDPRFTFRCSYTCTGDLTTYVPHSGGQVNVSGTIRIPD